MSSFCDFRFFDGVAVDIGFGEWGSQRDRRHVLSGVVRSGFFFGELDLEIFGVYGGGCLNLQCFCFVVFVEIIFDKFFGITGPFR